MNDEDCLNCLENIAECKCGDTEGYSSEGAVCPYCGHIDLASESEAIFTMKAMIQMIAQAAAKNMIWIYLFPIHGQQKGKGKHNAYIYL